MTDAEFLESLYRTAARQAGAALPQEEARRLATAITMAIKEIAERARKPEDYYDADPASLVSCVALSIRTRLIPGGPHPTVYIVPQRPRQGARSLLVATNSLPTQYGTSRYTPF